MGQKLGFGRRRRRKFWLFWKFPYSPPHDGGGEWIFCTPSWSHFSELDNLPPKHEGENPEISHHDGGENNILLPCFGGENDFLRGRIIFCYQDPERWGGRINSAHPNAKRWGHNELGSPPQDGGENASMVRCKKAQDRDVGEGNIVNEIAPVGVCHHGLTCNTRLSDAQSDLE